MGIEKLLYSFRQKKEKKNKKKNIDKKKKVYFLFDSLLVRKIVIPASSGSYHSTGFVLLTNADMQCATLNH